MFSLKSLFIFAAILCGLAVIVRSPSLAEDSKVAESSPPPVSESKMADSPKHDAKSSTRVQVLVASFTVFTLAVIVGFEIIAKVPPTLHTPLMSGSNAISGITVVGALLATGSQLGGFACFLGLIALILANINVVGGFLVTHRMLLMFKKK